MDPLTFTQLQLIIESATVTRLQKIYQLLPGLIHLGAEEKERLVEICGNRENLLWFDSLPDMPAGPLTPSGKKISGSAIQANNHPILPLTANISFSKKNNSRYESSGGVCTEVEMVVKSRNVGGQRWVG